MRIGTRMGTGMRQPTAKKDVVTDSVGYNTNVNIVNRPVTNHGVAGISATGQGPKRKIYDKSYYLNLLKSKNTEISSEITKFKKEIEVINKDNQTYLTLERKYDVLINDVRQLEGELADYNLAQDKFRAGTKTDDILALYHHIRMQNEKKKNQLDELFLERKEMENEISELERQITEINQANEEKLNELDPEQKAQYDKLRQENNQLIRDINTLRADLDEVNNKLRYLDGKLKEDTLRQRAQHLREERIHLLKKKEELELQTNESNLPFAEARDRLRNRIKQDHSEIMHCEKKIAELKKIIDTYQKNINELETDLAEQKTDQDESHKYEALHKRDREMTQFMETFDETCETETRQLEQLEANIVTLLEHMSKGITKSTALPSKNDVSNMKGDLAYTKGLVEDSENTYARVKVELEQRQNDLEKINTLEGKIERENKNMDEKLRTMQDEMENKFPKIDNLKGEYDNEKKRLTDLKNQLFKIKPGLAKHMTAHSIQHDTKKNQVLQSDVYKQLTALEKKIATNESQIYSL
jgi:intraflagellar transport protein 74